MRIGVISTYDKRGGAGRLFTFLLAFLISLAAVFLWVGIRIRPFVTSVAEGYAKNAVYACLSSVIEEELEKNDYTFIDIQRDDNGKVIAANVNALEISLLKSRLILSIKDKIAVMEEKKVSVPLGNFTPYYFLSGLGPKVPLRFLIISNTHADLEENFESGGINQTLYTLSLNTVTQVALYIPGLRSSVDIESEIPVAKTLILGDVPESYTNVVGVEGRPEDIILDAN